MLDDVEYDSVVVMVVGAHEGWFGLICEGRAAARGLAGCPCGQGVGEFVEEPLLR